ncbi:UDP-N-acetylmuramoylalanine--D-glutamate ligase [Paenibacillus sp. FSL A5-0031]|uniref:YuzB family protein n=1 Tax=unclassified Paenibacillus TaxID=185978 RepID=UPI00096CD522|nr:YuzB family protein [Paenibacillus sp. FSL A5-0031]OME85047.1 UDP-N-acetylmuramoylalanine--D-glutamate ligase [Paenibacillus sp. FSL A5-0031]
MFKTMIEFCASNMHHGTDRIMQLFEQNDEYEVTEYGCLGNCGECYLNPFALVEGAIVSADSVDELHDNILKAIEQQKADQDALDKLLDDL